MQVATQQECGELPPGPRGCAYLSPSSTREHATVLSPVTPKRWLDEEPRPAQPTRAPGSWGRCSEQTPRAAAWAWRAGRGSRAHPSAPPPGRHEQVRLPTPVCRSDPEPGTSSRSLARAPRGLAQPVATQGHGPSSEAVAPLAVPRALPGGHRRGWARVPGK